MVLRVQIKAVGFMLFLLTAGELVYGQYNIQHQAPIAIERSETNLLEFTAPGISQTDIQQARLFYRYDGDFSYKQMEVGFRNGVFSTQFNVDASNASTLEYYLEVTLISGEAVYYPASLPSENPVTVEIVDQIEEEKPQLGGVEYTILAPQPGNGVTSDDVFIAIALFYDISTLQPGEFKLYLDGRDVTGEADTSAYYFSYIPKGLRSGLHNVALEYATEDEDFAVAEWQFFVVAPGQASFTGFGESTTPQITSELTARNQVIAGDINNAYTGRTRISGQYGDLRYSLHGYLTSQESSRLQPQNRYGMELSYGEWWDLEAGHVYPYMSQFTISGRRVNGLNTTFQFLDDKLNLQFMYGEIDRSITNQYDSLVVQDIVNGSGTVVSSNYLLTYEDGGRGTFKRKIIGGRIGIGDERKFQVGFHALKIQDDTSSIFNARNYLDILNSGVSLKNDLSQAQRDSLIANPDLLEVSGGSIKPKGNVILGTDLKMGFLENRLRFESETVVSAVNDNIYGGALNIERADDLGFEIEKGTSDFLEQLSWLIIVNENMNALPFKFSENESGRLVGRLYLPSSVLANNSEFSFRQANNNVRLQYRWIGPNFSSLANSTIRKDIAGFTLTDRLNLLSNRIYLTLGYENLNDNVTGTRDATTETSTFRTNASWYPVDRTLPRLSIGFRFRTRANGVERQNYLLPVNLLNAAVQNIRQETRTINGQDSLVTIITPTPRLNKTINLNASVTQEFDLLNARNNASLSFNNIKTTDEVFAYGDVRSAALSLSLTSRFNDLPLETQLGFTYNNTESGSGQNQIDILGFYAGGNYRFMDNRFSVNGRLAFTSNNTLYREILIRDDPNSTQLNENPSDDYYVLSGQASQNTFQTYVIQAGAQFDIDEHHAVLFDANLTNVSGSGRANDRIVQLRYVFRF